MYLYKKKERNIDHHWELTFFSSLISLSLCPYFDIAHARLSSQLKETKSLPSYFKNHIVYYAGGSDDYFEIER